MATYLVALGGEILLPQAQHLGHLARQIRVCEERGLWQSVRRAQQLQALLQPPQQEHAHERDVVLALRARNL